MGLKRRAFLQRVSLAAGMFGLSQVGLTAMTSRYQQVLAQPTRRKLALLVGINQYPEAVCDFTVTRGSPLLGCVTDVELQRELLIHRFGFAQSDILTLTDQAATREAIASSYLSHLSDQARPGDVVLFHFSGLGSQVRLSQNPEVLRSSLVPVDGVLPTEESPMIHDLLEETLTLLLRSLPTDQVVTVLDASATFPRGWGLQGSLRVRSRPSTPTGEVDAAELALQEQLLTQSKTTRSQIQSQWQTGQLPGVVLSAASANQGALEGHWNGFSAGLFTYALTQELWWTTASTTLRVCLSRTTRTVNQLTGSEQQPRLSGQRAGDQSLPPYLLLPTPAIGADGVITNVDAEGQTVQIWLGGLPTSVLEYYGTGSVLSLTSLASPVAAIAPTPVAETAPPAKLVSVADSSDSVSTPASSIDSVPTSEPATTPATPSAAPSPATPSTTPATPAATPATTPAATPLLLQVRSRDGLTVKARLLGKGIASVTPGQLVQENVRVLPRNIGLTIALDASLERIERVDATSAFSSVPRVSAVIAGEQPADYLFGKTLSEDRTLTAALPTESDGTSNPPANLAPSRSRYGLFNLGRTAIPGTLTESGEAVKTAVNRIAPKLQTLLADKLLRLTSNRGSSRLGIRATLEMVTPQERIVLQQETVRAPNPLPEGKLAALFAGEGNLPKLPIGSRIRYRLQNYSDRPVHFMLLGMESNGNAIALQLPNLMQTTSTTVAIAPDSNVIPPGETLILPQPLAPSEWIVNPPIGLVATYFVFSDAPLRETLAVLKTALRSSETLYRLSSLMNPLEVAQAVLKDLHQASQRYLSGDVPTDSYSLSVDAWTTLSFLYQVVES